MKAAMQTKPLTQRQLFSMKRDTLESKIISYFQHTQDTASVIEYLVVVMLRNSLIVSDYSFLCRELICDLFMTAEPSEVLRKYCVYFKDYFKKGGEWDKVVDRLFRNRKEYHRFSEEPRLNKKLLDAPRTGTCRNSELELRFVSVFEDRAGKKHTLTIRDADETRTKTEASRILTTLSIFKRIDGVRRFAKFIKVSRPGTKETFEENEPQDEWQEPIQYSEVEPKKVQTIELIVPAGVDSSTLNEAELLELVRAAHPEVACLENIHLVFAEQKTPEPPLTESSLRETVSKSEPPEGSCVSKSSVGVAPPPTAAPQKSKKQRMLTPKVAYIQSLIAAKREDIGKGRNKNNRGKKKK